MSKIYIDSEYRCHVTNDGSMREFELSFFDGKCDAFVECFRYIPPCESWTRDDGTVFTGEMVAPWKDINILTAYQEQYEAMLPEMQDMRTALETLEVIPDGQMD